VAEQAVLHGTIALRTHVTINPEIGMTWLNEHIKLRDEMADNIEIQLVLFPSNIGENQHFVENLLLETRQQAVKILGCAPSVDPDPQRSINALFELAGKYDCDIDVHIDETDDPTINALELLAQRKIELGFTGSVNAAHCCSLSAMSECDSQRIIQKVADAGIHITTLPSCNLYLMGRMDKGLVRRGLTRVKELVSAGVTVAFGSDNIRDAFNPFGKADMLQEALITAHALQLGTPDEQDLLFNMATYNAARILSLNNYGLEPGCIGTLVVLDDKDWGSAVAKESTRLYVINRGRLVAQTTIHQELLLQSF
jgi:cytosine deaminase